MRTVEVFQLIQSDVPSAVRFTALLLLLAEPDKAPPPGSATARFVSVKDAPVESPLTFARTEYPPDCPFAVKAGAVAMPLLLVSAVAVAEPPKVALGPLEGAVNNTVAPLSGLPLL